MYFVKYWLTRILQRNIHPLTMFFSCLVRKSLLLCSGSLVKMHRQTFRFSCVPTFIGTAFHSSISCIMINLMSEGSNTAPTIQSASLNWFDDSTFFSCLCSTSGTLTTLKVYTPHTPIPDTFSCKAFTPFTNFMSYGHFFFLNYSMALSITNFITLKLNIFLKKISHRLKG